MKKVAAVLGFMLLGSVSGSALAQNDRTAHDFVRENMAPWVKSHTPVLYAECLDTEMQSAGGFPVISSI